MTGPIRILHLEDSPADAQLVREMLESDGLRCTITRVVEREEFAEKIEKDVFDLILSDFSLPGYNGMVALAIARAKVPDTPFIFVSGTIGEETAVESMKNGAIDYVLKDRLSRLPSSVRRALREIEEIRERNEVEQRYRLLAESAITGVYLVQDNLFRYVNPVFASIFGYGVEEIVDKLSPLVLAAPEDHSLILENIRKRVEGETKDMRYAFRGVRKDRTRIEVEVHGARIEYNGRPAIIGTLLDITERKRIEAKMKEQADLLDVDPDAILVLDLEGHIVFWSRGAERLYGWTRMETMGKRGNEILVEVEHPKFQEASKSVVDRGYWTGECNHKTKEGKQINVESQWTLVRDTDGRPKSIYVVNTNVTEKKQLQAQYLRAQRLESIGSLAGGVAHDLNNLLSPILLSVELLKRNIVDEHHRKFLDNIEKSANRGAGLVKQILSFVRGMEGEKISMSLKHIISELSDMLKSTFPASIRIETSVPKTLWTVEGDPTQLHQVFMNLCVNARDAMPSGGKIRISIENTVVDEQYANMSPGGKPGSYVRVIISDTGIGMPPEVLARIFEPFFTTKGTGKGTGLGLSTVHSIVKGHGGFVNVYSEVGKGTNFKVYLPASQTVQTLKETKKTAGVPFGHGELILVVDDEAAIREITKATLENYGYRVFIATDGIEALARFAQHAQEIKVVIIDMMMPIMDGKTTIRALQRIHSHTRFIAVSGSADEEKTAELMVENIRFLQKPFTAETLIQTVSELLADHRVKSQLS